jgi:hypothetical protein
MYFSNFDCPIWFPPFNIHCEMHMHLQQVL